MRPAAVLPGALAHVGTPGFTPLVAMGLFFVAMCAGIGVYFLAGPGNRLRAGRFALGGVAVGCLVAATALPFVVHPGPAFTRPSTKARLQILSPHPGETFTGSPATVNVRLGLTGGKIVPLTSIHLVANEGHIHLYVDGDLVSMTGLDASLTVPPGEHTLRAEFVAIDHGPFHPRVISSVRFRVSP
jgi:hypothetical protein